MATIGLARPGLLYVRKIQGWHNYDVHLNLLRINHAPVPFHANMKSYITQNESVPVIFLPVTGSSRPNAYGYKLNMDSDEHPVVKDHVLYAPVNETHFALTKSSSDPGRILMSHGIACWTWIDGFRLILHSETPGVSSPFS